MRVYTHTLALRYVLSELGIRRPILKIFVVLLIMLLSKVIMLFNIIMKLLVINVSSIVYLCHETNQNYITNEMPQQLIFAYVKYCSYIYKYA